MFQLPQHIYNYKIQIRFYVGCFNYSTCTTTKCKLYFVLDASTNSTYTTTKYKWGFERKQLQNECTYKKVGPTPLFCTKRPLAGNRYCSPSPPLYVVVIWSQLLFGHYQPPLAALPHHLQSTRASCGSCPSQRVCWKPFRILLRLSVRPGDDTMGWNHTGHWQLDDLGYLYFRKTPNIYHGIQMTGYNGCKQKLWSGLDCHYEVWFCLIYMDHVGHL